MMDLPAAWKWSLAATLEWLNTDLGAGATDCFLFTYRRTDASVSAGITPSVETAVDLDGPWTTAENGVAGVVVLEDDNFIWINPAAEDTDRVRVYVPVADNPKMFGRLKVSVP